jgi:hypothetical protein
MNGTRPIDAFVSELRRTVEEAAFRLVQIPESESGRAPAPGKWSRKEIVGHLIDSAANNHQRFVRARFQDDLVFPGYDQDAWVGAQNYRAAQWLDLVPLWMTYNLHLAHVIANLSDDLLLRVHCVHSLDRLAWRAVPKDVPTTLDYFVRDYAGHMRHHLAQALDDQPLG